MFSPDGKVERLKPGQKLLVEMDLQGKFSLKPMP
jgi:hypothetical protein